MKLKFNAEKILFLIVLLLLSTKAISQIDPGVDFDLNGYINSRLDAGETTVTVPAGRYRVSPTSNTHLSFSNRNNVTIIADGVEMICTKTVPAVKIIDCDNLKIKGLSVDYDPLTFTQGVIVGMSSDKKTLTIDIIDGYPTSNIIGGKLEIFDSATSELTTSTYYNVTIQVDELAKRIVAVKPGVGNEKVGDITVFESSSSSIPHTFVMERCNNLVFEEVTLYAGSTFGFFESYCNASKYINCAVDRRALETDIKVRAVKRMRSTGADAFHSKHAEKGPSYVGCIARYNGDDSYAVTGVTHVITETNGNVLSVVCRDGGNVAPDLSVGEKIELVSYSGVKVMDAEITNFEPGRALTTTEKNFLNAQTLYGIAQNIRTASRVYYITLDQSVDLPMGSTVNSATQVGNGVEVINCIAGPNRSRGIIIKSGYATITGNSCVGNWGQAIKLAPEYGWLIGGSGSNIVVSDNQITACRTTPIVIDSRGGDGNIAPVGAHDNVQIVNNTISNSPNPAIIVTSTSNLCMKNNIVSAVTNSETEEISLTNVEQVDCNSDNLTYTIGYETDGGTHTNPTTYTPQSNTIILTPAMRPDYNFIGWYLEPSHAVEITEISSGSSGHMLLFAKWDIMVTPTTNEVTNISGPATVTQGEMISVNIEYSATESRDIVVNLQENNNDLNGDNYSYSNIGSSKCTVDAGSGIVAVEISVDAMAPAAVGAYRYVSYITTVGGGFANRFDSGIPQTGITVEEIITSLDNERNVSDEIHVYPNPTHDVLNVVIELPYDNPEVTIVDLSGRVLMNERLPETLNSLDVSSISEGVYILQIKDGDRVIGIQKIILYK